ncbi:hypothetical protein M5K25_001090 [Dendrobium thyrsiflorum]|uniref:HMA domain-containing protein n=1 Tax=Dendrobium thyrsiflorum TaxID=117978 RepID=A0ABD0VYU0_DENTH
MASNLLSNFQDINFPSSSSPSSSTGKSSSSSLSHGRAIDRYSPHLRDPLREKYFSRNHSKAKPCNPKNRKNTEKSPQIISPATSSRYLLNDMPVAIDDFSDTESFPPMISMEELRFDYLKGEALTFMESPSPPPVRQRDQVAVLKVSLHCKGCEAKVRKHISKMKGVTSFTTDLATKKVTVIGDLTPLSVLNSISKVKKAQFWSSP